MASKKYKKCPHCGRRYATEAWQSYIFIDSPFKKCMFCGKPFIDSETKEWITMTQSERNAYLKGGEENDGGMKGFLLLLLYLGFTIALIVATIALLGEENTFIAVIFKIGLVLFDAVLVYFDYKEIVKYIEGCKNFKVKGYDSNVKISLCRTLNYQYLENLQKAGFSINLLNEEEAKANDMEYYNDKLKKVLNEKQNLNEDEVLEAKESINKSENIRVVPENHNNTFNYCFSYVVLRQMFEKENIDIELLFSVDEYLRAILIQCGSITSKIVNVKDIKNDYLFLKFEREKIGNFKVLIIYLPDAMVECDTNYIALVYDTQNRIKRFFSSELYYSSNEFLLCEYTNNKHKPLFVNVNSKQDILNYIKNLND